MGKDKLRRFRENLSFECFVQPEFDEVFHRDHPLKGNWRRDFFRNDNPIVLELGCGKGEYTVGLAKRYPDRNYIGLDIKGARMWHGARQADADKMGNVAFLRTNIELLTYFFAPGEVSEIWITFPDPQMKKVRKRLTSTRFVNLYRQVCKPDAVIRLKTDSPFLYAYTRDMLAVNGIIPLGDTSDLYADTTRTDLPDGLKDIRTYYEQQWLSRGLTIKYLGFTIPADDITAEPETEPEHDSYRSFSRGVLQGNVPMPENGA